MDVYKKRMANGDLSLNYHFRVEVDGRPRERDTGTSDKATALAYAKKFFTASGNARGTRSVVRTMLNDAMRRETVLFDEAFELFAAKPVKRPIGEEQMRVKRRHWEDFVWFIRDNCSWVVNLSDVSREMAAEYLHFLRTHGKYRRAGTQRVVEFNRRMPTENRDECQQLSPANCNAYHSTLQQVFHVLFRDASLIENPFDALARLDKDDDAREAFTPAEIKRIGEHADTFLFPIVAVGIYTGLPEDEICVLRCEEVDLDEAWITHKLAGTGMLARVPILPRVHTYLARLKEQAKNDYLLPAQAEACFERKSAIRRRLTDFLESLDLRRKTRQPGRSTMSSIKDAQSLRHTFCYVAAANALPLPVIKNIVGHVSQEIADLYGNGDEQGLQRVIEEYRDDYLGLPESGPLKAPAEHGGSEHVVCMLKSMTPENWAFMRDELLQLLAAR